MEMNQLHTYISNSHSEVIAICGGAGSGKSTFARHYPTSIEIDKSFIGNSDFRKNLLAAKAKSLESYIDCCTMMNWWDWENVIEEIEIAKTVVFGLANMDNFYGNRIILNGAILGPKAVLNHIDEVIYVHVSKEKRFQRLCSRDSYKRTFTELLARFLLTEFAENMYYANLFKTFRNIKVVDEDFNFMSHLDLDIFKENQYIPFPV